MNEESTRRTKLNTPDVKVNAAASRAGVVDEDTDESLLDDAAPESLREILEAPVVANFVEFLRESSAKQTDLAKRQAERAFEIQRQQLEIQAAEAERQFQIEKQQLELAAAHGRWARWVVVAMLVGLSALFVWFRERPEVAIDVAKGLAALAGAVGIGWSLRRSSPQRRE